MGAGSCCTAPCRPLGPLLAPCRPGHSLPAPRRSLLPPSCVQSPRGEGEGCYPETFDVLLVGEDAGYGRQREQGACEEYSLQIVSQV